MKRRIIALATVTALTLALSACGATEESNGSTPTVEQSSQTVTVEPTEVPEVTPTEAPVEPTVVPTEAPEVTVEATETPAEPTEAPKVEDDGTLWAVVEELLPLEASERTAYLESKYGTRYVITVENNLDKLLPTSLTAEQKEIAYENFLGAMDWCFCPSHMGGARPSGEYYLTLLTDTTTGQAHALWFSICLNILECSECPVDLTSYVKECNPRDFYEIFYKHVEDYALGFDINGDGVIGYNEALYVSETEEPTDEHNFEVIKNMIVEMMTDGNASYSCQEFTSIIETMDESRYVVKAVEGLAPILKDGLSDAERQAAVEIFLSWPTFREAEVELENERGTYTDYVFTTPTGEMYTMTLTDTVTGETIAWSFRIIVEADDTPGAYGVIEETVGGFVIANMTVDVADFYSLKY